MTYAVSHTYVDEPLPLDLPQVKNIVIVTCSASGEIAIRAPGKLQVSASAVYSVLDESSNAGGPSKNGPNNVDGSLQHLPDPDASRSDSAAAVVASLLALRPRLEPARPGAATGAIPADE
jgi:hypothetical protein